MFNVDYNRKHFVQASCPENIIKFQDLQENDDHYLLSLKSPRHTDSARPYVGIRYDQKTVLIDKEIINSPEKVLDQDGYCTEHNKQSYEQKRNILLIDQPVAERLQGKLPVIEISPGQNFYVDVRMRELRLQDDFSKSIQIKGMYLHGMDGFQFHYAPENHELVKLPTDLIEYPVGVIGVYLPSEKAMDPIGYARLNGWEETALLPKYCQRSNLKAVVRPLSKTWINSDIKRNRAEAASKGTHKMNVRRNRKNGRAM